MNLEDKIYVAGHNGLIGSAIVRQLEKKGYKNIITRDSSHLDLRDQAGVKSFFEAEQPDYVFFAAGKVGGVFANDAYRADFIYENIIMQTNVIHSSFLTEVKKLLFLATADIYPKDCPQPAKEEYLLTGPLETTSEPFALAKIAGAKMCESYNRQFGTDFIVMIPPNVYGPRQHYDIMNAQVLPSLIKRFHEAKIAKAPEVVLWGTGSPVRDFLYVEDVAKAATFLMDSRPDFAMFNIGTGDGYTVAELSNIIKKQTGYQDKIVFDKTKPDGVQKKLLDISRIKELGWKPKIDLVKGVELAYKSFLSEIKKEEVRTARIINIEAGKKDKITLKQINSKEPVTKSKQPSSYKNKVVLKPWGYECLVFENELVAVWFLHIKKGHSTSMHCHPLKKTALTLLSGNSLCSTFESRTFLRGGDTLAMGKGVFHSTKSLSDDGIFLLEIESPPLKTDLVRLGDRYGREQAGYEGITEMKTDDLFKYGHFYFEEAERNEKTTHSIENFDISLEVYLEDEAFQGNFDLKEGETVTCCKGSLLDRSGNTLLDTGDNRKSDVFINADSVRIDQKTVLLRTQSRGV